MTDREILAAWMIQFGFATGHGDTMEQLVDALGSEIVERVEYEIETERLACAARADIALLGADRGVRNRVMQAIRESKS